MSNSGKIVQVIGPVVDVQFAENAIPPIYQALTVEFAVGGKKETLTLEIQQHLGGGIARAIAMSSSEGLVRGMAVADMSRVIQGVVTGVGFLGAGAIIKHRDEELELLDSERQLRMADAVATTGFYSMVSMTLIAFDVDPPAS